MYSFLSADHGKLSSERPPNISFESLKLNDLNKEVAFLGSGLMHYELCLVAIQSFNLGALY